MEKYLSSKQLIAIAGAGVMTAAVIYYLQSHKKMPTELEDPDFHNENLVSYGAEAEARALQISNVSYNLLLKLGETQEEGF